MRYQPKGRRPAQVLSVTCIPHIVMFGMQATKQIPYRKQNIYRKQVVTISIAIDWVGAVRESDPTQIGEIYSACN